MALLSDTRFKIVLVTGSRNWSDAQSIWDALEDELPDVLIHGACERGADSVAADYGADGHNSAVAIPMPAQWSAHGRGAGPMRNTWMVDMLQLLRRAGHDCVVHAFPLGESPGTRDCILKAKKADFTVYEHSEGEG